MIYVILYIVYNIGSHSKGVLGDKCDYFRKSYSLINAFC